MKHFFFILVLIPAFSFAKTYKSGIEQIPLLELFSSEGCSSCPPAEKQLYALRSNPDVWKKFTAINFHVDYWNQLGWIDRFSRDQFTKHQNNYANAWGISRIYTPEFVLNGKEAGSSFKNFPTSSKQKTSEIILRASIDQPAKIEIILTQNSSRNLKVYYAILGNGLESKVTSGENKGETLKHNFVVFSLDEKEISFSKNSDRTTIKFPWPKLKEQPSSLSVVAWVADKQTAQTLQSVGGDL